MLTRSKQLFVASPFICLSFCHIREKTHPDCSAVVLSLCLMSSSPPGAGADVPETEAGSREGEATSRAGALQEVFDAATDALAERQPLQGLPSQVTPPRPPNSPRAPGAAGRLPLQTDTQSLFFTTWSTWLHRGEYGWLR